MDGRVHYNRQNLPEGVSHIPNDSVGLFDLVHRVFVSVNGEIIDGVLLSEDGDYLITEDGDYISLES